MSRVDGFPRSEHGDLRVVRNEVIGGDCERGIVKRIQAVDLFCGAGGASVGLRRACESMNLRTDLLAVNHWPVAVETHTLNHPDVKHLCESIERVDPLVAVPGGRLQLLIAAPECTFFSTARGGRPVTDQQRTQPWVVLKWLQELYVDNLLLENVPEFVSWGPVGANGKPLKSKRGHTFRAFIDTIASLGYRVDHRILNAADYGDPTTRRRLFVIAKRGNKQPHWPMPTHSRTGHRTLFGPTKKWRAAREVIDWSIQGKSIFGRKRPLSPKTMARIVAGLERFGGKDLQPFLVLMRGTSRGHVANSARSIEDPLSTLTAGGGHHALIEPFVIPVTHGGGTERSHDIEQPLPTITCANRGELAVVEAFVLQQQSGGVPRRTDEPLPTIATDGAQMLVEPFLVPHFGERPTQAPRTHSIDEPVPTIAATGQIDIVQPFLVSAGGPKVGARSTEEPMNTVLTRGHMALVEPVIASYYGTGLGVSPVSDPLPTVTTKDRFALVMPVVNGQALDIRLRMLKPHELAKAMSFGDDYQFAGNQGEQVKQIGNAWPCRLGQALIETLLEDYAAKKKPRQLEAIA